GDAPAPLLVVDEVPERQVHRDLVDPGLVDVARDADEAGPTRLLRAEAGVLLGPNAEDGRQRGDGLDVVDHRGAAEETRDRGEGRLQARPALAALEAVEKAGLLATDVGARAAVDVDVQAVSGIQDALAEDPLGVAVGDRLLQDLRLLQEFTADVDVGGV